MPKRIRRKPALIQSELELTEKYRPCTLKEIYGNSLLKKEIGLAIENNDIPKAILLQGENGCGKTTIARILAKELNCSKFDLKEIDIADFSGVDLIRSIRQKMKTSPMEGDVKVYIFDEAHRMSSAGQTAMFKMLEPPPKHCYFFLCTTDPQKLLAPLRGRCIPYTVQTLSEKQIFNLLMKISAEEQIPTTKKVALQIARDSLGHPRNAVKILNKIRYLNPEDMLNMAKLEAEKEEKIIELCRAIIGRKSWKIQAGILRGLKDEPETVRRAIRGYFASVLLNGQESAFIVLDAFSEPFYNTDGKNELIRCTFDVYKELQ